MKTVVFFLILIFFYSCSFKSYKNKHSALITIKSKSLKYSDIGFISKDENRVKLKLFSLGREILKIEIDSLLCLNNKCIPKYFFNKNYLSSKYPSSILKNILLGKPIFNSKNLIKIKNNNFSQKIDTIEYKVTQKNIYFRDSLEKILIRIAYIH